MMRGSLKILASANQARVHRAGLYCTVLFLFLMASALCAFGQDATIVGTVSDPSGASVAGASVTVTNSETGQEHHFVTGGQGEYVAPDIHIGHYTVRVEATGFKAEERKGITLQVGDRARVDFQMQVGTTKETVTVEATAVAVQADTSEISQVVTGDQLSHLGTNGRSMYTFLNLTTGASNLQGDRQTPTPVGGDATVSFNGNRPVHNLFVIDGGEDADRGGGGTSAVMPSLEAIGEFRTLTSNYDAEYGLSSAATMTTVFKSGTTKYHASAWEYFRNNALDANNYFHKKSELRYNIFGANVGGPIDFWKKQHKSFFFYNMEWRRTVDGGSVFHDVPSTDEYPDATTPGFAVLANAINVPTTAQVDPSIIFANCPGGQAPLDITGLATIQQGKAFPGNGIPDCMIDGNATALLGAGIFPANNAVDTKGLPAFSGGANAPTYVREEIVRVDHTFNDKVSVFGHFVDESVLQTFATTMWSGDNMPSVGNTFGNPSYSGVAHMLHTIHPNLLNEVAFNYSGNRINILPLGTPALLTPSGYNYGKVFPGTNPNIPSIALNNGTGANYSSNWTPWINKYNDYQIKDDVSWTKGAHQLRMGGSWALYKKQQDVFASTQGSWGFDGSFAGDSFADFLLGYAQDYQEDAIHDHGNWNAVSWAAYVQDNWRVNKKLTLNLGLRWDGVPHTYEVNKRMSSFYSSLYQTANAATFDSAGNICSSATDPGCIAASPGLGTSSNPILAGVPLYLNGIGIGGEGVVPRGMVNNHWAAFGPRLGFAYDLTGQGKTVIRGGFGIMYERIQGNDMYDAATNVPADAHVELHNVLFQNPNTLAATGATAVAPIVATSITGFDALQYKLPISTQFSVGVEQALGAKAVLSVSYVGNQNRHQNFYQEINAPPLADLPALVAGTSATPYNQLVQYPGFHSIRLATNEANSHYNSLQTSVRGRVARDLEIQAGWTYSKAVDPTTGGGNGFDLDNITNPYAGWRFDQGPSVFDRRNIVFINYIYDIPLFRNSANHVAKTALGGWQLSSIISLMSGAPLNITMGGTTAASVVPNSNVRPDLTGSISYPKKIGEWFDPSAFSAPDCGSGPDCFGNLGHDALRGPGRDNWNMSLFKNFTFTERARLEFRVDAFNIFNHTQWIGNVNQGGIDTNVGDGSFGAVNGAYDPRILQLGLKLVF